MTIRNTSPETCRAVFADAKRFDLCDLWQEDQGSLPAGYWISEAEIDAALGTDTGEPK